MTSKASPFTFTERDRETFERSYLTIEMVEAQGWWRAADSINGTDAIGHTPTALTDFSGYVIAYFHPLTGLERERVLRLDRPDDKGKYRGPFGRTNMFFIPRGVKVEWLKDKSIAVVFCEGEKKSLALWRIALEKAAGGVPPFIPVGLRGVWGWVGQIGNKDLPSGGHEREKGPLNDFDFLEWAGREAFILFDSNVHSPKLKTRDSIRAARSGLASHLHYTLGARVLLAEMTREHFEQGINGPDDLAAAHGPQAVLELLDDASEAFKVKKYQPREKLSAEERKARADALRKAAGQNAESLASDVIGSTAAKHLARLWAEAGLSPESRDLLFTLEAMAMGCEAVEFYYADLYPLLFKLRGNEFEQTVTGSRVLKSSPRKRLRERFEKLEAEQREVAITFAHLTEGHKDETGHVPSHVALFSRGYVAEVMIMAEEDPLYSRGKKAARERAFAAFVREKSGVAYIRRRTPRINRSKQIADGWKRVEGNLKATIKRMRDEGIAEDAIWHTMAEFMPPEFLAFVIAKMGDLQIAATPADSADDSARFPKTCKKSAKDDPEAVELWDRFVAKAQGGEPATAEPMSTDQVCDSVEDAIFAEGVQ